MDVDNPPEGIPHAPDHHRLLLPSEISFQTVCDFLDYLVKHGNDQRKKRDAIQKFIDTNVVRESGQAFDIFRLILPNLDTERGNYNLKEATLGRVYMKALAWGKDQAAALLDFRNPGITKALGTGAGDLSRIVETLRTPAYNGLTEMVKVEREKKFKIGDVNNKLDQLAAAAGNRTKQAEILRDFFMDGTPHQLMWLTQIILKYPKIRTGESVIFREWHPDAQEFYNQAGGMSLRAVFNNLIDKTVPVLTDIVLGKSIRPQLAKVVYSSDFALKLLRAASAAQGGQAPAFVIETKFDGERIQVHRIGDTVHYYSRKAIEHGERSNYTIMDEAIIKATAGLLGPKKTCILDGELVVWNKARNTMESFGTLKHTVNLALEQKSRDTTVMVDDYGGVQTQNGTATWTPPKLGDLEVLYVAFDVLYANEKPVIHFPLRERHKILAEVIPEELRIPISAASGVTARVVPLLPDNTHIGDVLASVEVKDGQHAKEAIDEALERVKTRREEGIVIKNLDSQWKSNDRGSSWLKMKPDYVRQLEIDAVILGGWYGEGRRGGQVISQYLMGLLDTSTQPIGGSNAAEPTCGNLRFVTFCSVGTGLSDDERAYVSDELVRLCVKDPAAVPACVRATGREKPDVWITDPSQSIVLQLHADVRLIASINFASKASLRFPRVDRLRNDKPVSQAMPESLLLQQTKERLQMDINKAEGRSGKKKRGASGARRPVVRNIWYEQERLENIKKTEKESEIFAGEDVYIYQNAAPGDNRPNVEHYDSLVVRMGGKIWLSLKQKVSVVVAYRGDSKEVKAQIARGKSGDPKHPDRTIYSVDWLERCFKAQQMCPPRPRDYFYMAAAAKESLQNVDQYGDSYYATAQPADVAALVKHHIKTEDLNAEDLVQELLAKPEIAARPAALYALHDADAAVKSRAGVRASARTLLSWLDMELEGLGKLDPSRALLHGCTLLIVDVPTAGSGGDGACADGSEMQHSAQASTTTTMGLFTATSRFDKAESDIAATVHKLRLSSLKLSAQVHGAEVVSEMTLDVTHVIGVMSSQASNGGSAAAGERELATMAAEAPALPAPSPSALLRAVKDLKAPDADIGSVNALHRALEAGTVHLVTVQWLEDSTEAVSLMDSKDYPLLDSEAMSSIGNWPWQEFAPRKAAGAVGGRPGSAGRRGGGGAGGIRTEVRGRTKGGTALHKKRPAAAQTEEESGFTAAAGGSGALGGPQVGTATSHRLEGVAQAISKPAPRFKGTAASKKKRGRTADGSSADEMPPPPPPSAELAHASPASQSGFNSTIDLMKSLNGNSHNSLGGSHPAPPLVVPTSSPTGTAIEAGSAASQPPPAGIQPAMTLIQLLELGRQRKQRQG